MHNVDNHCAKVIIHQKYLVSANLLLMVALSVQFSFLLHTPRSISEIGPNHVRAAVSVGVCVSLIVKGMNTMNDTTDGVLHVPESEVLYSVTARWGKFDYLFVLVKKRPKKAPRRKSK